MEPTPPFPNAKVLHRACPNRKGTIWEEYLPFESKKQMAAVKTHACTTMTKDRNSAITLDKGSMALLHHVAGKNRMRKPRGGSRAADITGMHRQEDMGFKLWERRAAWRESSSHLKNPCGACSLLLP
eukprot:scaffold320_cov335-Pavlova_lutheri.AAC.15